MTLTVNGVALYNINKAEKESESLGSFNEAELNLDEHDTVREVAQRLVENLIDDTTLGQKQKTPKYGHKKNARAHAFSAEASEGHHNLGSTVTIEVLEALRKGVDFDQNAAHVAEWYLQEKKSLTALLIIASYEYDGEDYVIILKTPYIENAYQVDPESVLSEAEQVIQGDAEKSIIYPYRDPATQDIDRSQVKVYNGKTSYTAGYWRRFVQLEEALVPDEELFEYAKDEDSELAQVQSTADFQSVAQKVETGEIPDGEVTITVDGEISFDAPITEVLANEDIRFAQEGDSEFVILRGRDINFTAKKRNNGTDIFGDVTAQSLSEALQEYLN